VGSILAVIGPGLIFAQISGEISASVMILAIGSALRLAVLEFVYVAKRVISPIYLGDAFLELLFIGWWIMSIGFS
jgi:hypothetical protein